MAQLSFGEALRDQGILHVWEATSDAWRAAALDAIATLAREGVEFTSEDVRARVGDPPKPNAMGAAFQLCARRRLIRKVGFTRATRPSLHATDLAIWVGTTTFLSSSPAE